MAVKKKAKDTKMFVKKGKHISEINKNRLESTQPDNKIKYNRDSVKKFTRSS